MLITIHFPMIMDSERKSKHHCFIRSINRNQETSLARKYYADCISTKICLKRKQLDVYIKCTFIAFTTDNSNIYLDMYLEE